MLRVGGPTASNDRPTSVAETDAAPSARSRPSRDEGRAATQILSKAAAWFAQETARDHEATVFGFMKANQATASGSPG